MRSPGQEGRRPKHGPYERAIMPQPRDYAGWNQPSLVPAVAGELALHPLVEARDIDHDPGMHTVAHALLFIEGLDAEFQVAAFHPGQLGGGAQAHADRRRGVMPDVKPRAEA